MNKMIFIFLLSLTLFDVTSKENAANNLLAYADSEKTVISDKEDYSGNNRSQKVSGKSNGHDYVDLGLSVKWATCNIGASNPEDYGNYFAWGETVPKEEYTKDNSITYRKRKFGEKINVGGNPKYDAAAANWGGGWRMPTCEEIEELYKKCTWKWTEMNGVKGCKVIGPNGNSIFLPAAGEFRRILNYNAEEYGYYWSSKPSTLNKGHDAAYQIYFSKSCEGRDIAAKSIFIETREHGKTIRPVIE